MHQLRDPLSRSPDRGGPLSAPPARWSDRVPVSASVSAPVSASASSPASGRGISSAGRSVQASGVPRAARLRLVVCGEPSRGDDGLGPAAVEAVLARLPPSLGARVEVRRRRGLDPVDLLDLPDEAAALVVDCVVGPRPGSLVRLPLEELARSGRPAPASTHSLPIADVLHLARVVAGRSPRGVFLGLAGASFELGAPLSPAVAGALPAFGQAIRTEIERLLGEVLVYSPDE